MQHITLLTIDENGNEIKRSDINFAEIMLDVFGDSEYQNKYPWLSTIDPYGLTFFNQLQIKNLVEDLKRLPDSSNGKIKDSIDYINNLGDLEYVKLIGD
jgi:hypothetical protein